MKKLPTAVGLLACLAGCATGPTEPTYQNYKEQDAACIKGDIPNLIKAFSEGEAHVMIKEIDGAPTDAGKRYCFAPGKHQLGVYAYNSYQTAQDYVDLEFEAGKKYWLHANLRGISFVFQLVDVTSPPETKVAEFRLKVGSTTQSASFPIFIPIK